MNPTAAEVLLKVAELLEAEDKWSAALNRPDPDCMPFAASEIDSQVCRPLRVWLQTLDPAHLRALAAVTAENAALVRGAQQLGEAFKAHRAAPTPQPAPEHEFSGNRCVKCGQLSFEMGLKAECEHTTLLASRLTQPQPTPDALREALEAALKGFEHLASLSSTKKSSAGLEFMEAGNIMTTIFDELEEEARILEIPCQMAGHYAKQARAALAAAQEGE